MKLDTKKLTILAMLSALAFLAVFLIRIPAVAFLSYEPKDVIFAIGGFMFGPLSVAAMSAIVSLIEMVTISSTGIIGCVMNILSSCSFACTAAYVYKKKRTLQGAIVGLVIGCVIMCAIMLLWNYLITPLYMQNEGETIEQTRAFVASKLLPWFLPFNLVKGTINGALTMLLYKPVTTALRRARLLEPSSSQAPVKHNLGLILVLLFVLVTCVLALLVMQGKL